METARSQCLTDLYLRLAHEKLTPLAYPAAQAGLSFSVGAMPTGTTCACVVAWMKPWGHPIMSPPIGSCRTSVLMPISALVVRCVRVAGLGLSLSGYADRTLGYWDACLTTLVGLQWTSDDFARLRDQLLLDYRSVAISPGNPAAFPYDLAALLSLPPTFPRHPSVPPSLRNSNALASMVISQAMQAAGRSHLLHPVRPEDKLATMESLTVDDAVAFQRELFQATILETLVGGAADADTALAVQAAVRARLQGHPADPGTRTARALASTLRECCAPAGPDARSLLFLVVPLAVKQLPRLREDVGSALTLKETTTRSVGPAAQQRGSTRVADLRLCCSR